MPYNAREIVLAIAVVATLVGAFLNYQVVAKALRATEVLKTATADSLK